MNNNTLSSEEDPSFSKAQCEEDDSFFRAVTEDEAATWHKIMTTGAWSESPLNDPGDEDSPGGVNALNGLVCDTLYLAGVTGGGFSFREFEMSEDWDIVLPLINVFALGGTDFGEEPEDVDKDALIQDNVDLWNSADISVFLEIDLHNDGSVDEVLEASFCDPDLTFDGHTVTPNEATLEEFFVSTDETFTIDTSQFTDKENPEKGDYYDIEDPIGRDRPDDGPAYNAGYYAEFDLPEGEHRLTYGGDLDGFEISLITEAVVTVVDADCFIG